MSVSRQALRDLDLRASVPDITQDLLRRAEGLDLLYPDANAEQVTKLEHLSYKLKPGESDAGIDFDAPIDQCRVVLVTEKVNYPIAGYPEAYGIGSFEYTRRCSNV